MQYKYIVLINTTIGAFMSALDANIVIISLPTIIRSLPGTSTLDGIWIILGYILVTATLLLTIGRLGDMFGRVKIYNIGFAVFTIGSALCSVSPNGLSLIFFRLIQGGGSALIWSNSAAILTDAFPATERGRALGMNQVAGSAGSVLGLVAGGVLTDLLGWRSIFWINIPIGIFATSWAYLKLKELSVPVRGKIDIIGNSLFGAGLILFLLGLTLGAIQGWAQTDLVMMVLGVSALVAFFFVETRVENPMMDIGLFKIRPFSAGALATLLSAISRNSLSLILVIYFQGALHYSILEAGLLLLPLSIAFVTFGPVCGYFSDKLGARRFATTGMIVVTIALLWFASLPFNVTYDILALAMVLTGAGSGMFVAPNTAAVMNSVPTARRGVASGITSAMVNVGSLVSLGLVFAIFGASISVGALQAIFAGQTPPGGGLDITLFAEAMREIFIILAVISFICIIPTSQTASRRKETIIYSTSESG